VFAHLIRALELGRAAGPGDEKNKRQSSTNTHDEISKEDKRRSMSGSIVVAMRLGSHGLVMAAATIDTSDSDNETTTGTSAHTHLAKAAQKGVRA
jgi:hypothetical protein